MKNPISFLLFLIFICSTCYSQELLPRANSVRTVADSRLQATLNFFTPRYADTTAANAGTSEGIDSCGSLIFTYDIMGLWVRKCSPKRWEQAGGVVDVGEGLSASGTTANLGGPVGTEAQFSTDRVINTLRKGMYWTNGTPIEESGGNVWQHTDKPYSPFQFWSADTLTSNLVDPPTAEMPLSGIFARRTMYYNDGILKTQKTYGHYIGQTYDWKDTMTFQNAGGDYQQGVTIEQRLKPRGTGKQATGVHGTGNQGRAFWGTATLLSNTVLENSGSNYIYTRGWLVGVQSYVVLGFNTADTMDAFSFYQTNGLISSSSHIKKAFGIDFQHNTSGAAIDSSFGLWDQYGYRHWLRGNTVIGPRTDSSVTDYNFKVNGTSYLRGMIQGFQGTDVASTAGVMTLSNTGNVYEITGTNTVTAINNTNLKNGYEVTLLFTSTATLTDGTANSGAAIGIELAGNANFTGSADDTITLILGEIGGTQRWREKCRSVN